MGGCTSQQVVASSSASGQPCAISATNPYKIDYLSMNEPMQYLPRDLRLNIYTVTWGSKICTDFVRQKYITSTIANPPTDSSNSWSIDASNTNFSDGDPNVAKALVIFYRVAQVIGHTDGIINGPNDPPPWSDDYRTKNIQPLHTNRYPVLKDFTKFYMATAREGFTINIDLLSMLPLQPYTVFPEPQNRPFIAAAAWSTRQVTDYTIDSVRNTPAGTDTRLSVGTATMVICHRYASGKDAKMTVGCECRPSGSLVRLDKTMYRPRRLCDQQRPSHLPMAHDHRHAADARSRPLVSHHPVQPPRPEHCRRMACQLPIAGDPRLHQRYFCQQDDVGRLASDRDRCRAGLLGRQSGRQVQV